ncbi:MAG: prenyltransferase/squalene oxidase repeat-containing protein, partial [Verrucomicrobiales bacterium]
MRAALAATLALGGTLALALPASAERKWEETTPVPVTPENIDSAIRRGADFLLVDQNKNGSWGSATRTKDLNIYAPIPGSHQAFQAACTAMAIEALWESGLAKDDPKVQESIDRAEKY